MSNTTICNLTDGSTIYLLHMVEIVSEARGYVLRHRQIDGQEHEASKFFSDISQARVLADEYCKRQGLAVAGDA